MSKHETMRGMCLKAHGSPEVLVYRTYMPLPVPGRPEVPIRVGAAGVNNTGINTRVGWYSKADGDAEDASWVGVALGVPCIQGADICGEGVGVGEDADIGLIGKRVFVEPCLQEANGDAPIPLENRGRV